MNQAPEEYKRLIKKLLTATLTPQERSRLNELKLVERAIKAQWENTSPQYTDAAKEQRILNRVLREIKKEKKSSFAKAVNRYSWVASLTLLLICGALSVVMLTRPSTPSLMYVVNSGRQSMDSVRLPDGTFVMLNAGSRLTYPEAFTGENREVALSGQAFFQVSKDATRPFIVKTKDMDVTALGTSFEVFSFDKDKSVETILLTGRVKIETKNETDEKVTGEYLLSPNEKFTYDDNGTVSIEAVDANAYSAWRIGGRLSFKNEKLSMILPRLEKWYGQKIECSEKIANHYRFTFTVRTEPLDLILNIMSHSAPLSYNLKSNEEYVLKELGKHEILTSKKNRKVMN